MGGRGGGGGKGGEGGVRRRKREVVKGSYENDKRIAEVLPLDLLQDLQQLRLRSPGSSCIFISANCNKQSLRP